MIKYYCQFSYGGYKVFKINGLPHEELRRIVASDDEGGFPLSADLYFNYGGAKIVYRYLGYNTLDLVISDIPGPELDTDGRPISCAVQFIGDRSDRRTLDNLAIRIANNLEKFEKEFADMFDLWGGLHFEGDKLDAFVKQCENKDLYEKMYKNKKGDELLQILDRQGEVLLFVPFSDNFPNNTSVKEKLMDQLQLPNDATIHFITYSKLANRQYWLNEPDCDVETKNKTDMIDKVISIVQSINGNVLDDKTKETLMQNAEQLHSYFHEKENECQRLRSSAVEANKEAESFKQELNNRKNLEKKCLYAIGAVFFVMLLIIIVK